MSIGVESRSRASGAFPRHAAWERRKFLTGAAAAALTAIAPHRAVAAIPARAEIDEDHPGTPIAPEFLGLSYESAILADGHYFAPGNASVVGLIRRLGERGVIRLGGNLSERTVWGERPRGAGDIPIGPAAIDRLSATLRALGWRLIYGLNLGSGTPEQAAEEAAYVAHAVGERLIAFQIGNEPDGYGRWAPWRRPGYGAADFLAEWRAFHAAIRARVPDARFAGPDVAAETEWVAALAAARPQGLVLLTRHYYADGPRGAPHISIDRLLRSAVQVEPVLARLAEIGRTHGLPWRLAEANSVFNEGHPGVSDTLAAALWAVELMFRVAAAGGTGINFHTGVNNFRPDEDKAYTPIARADSGRYRATPLYYGLLMFAETARGRLVPLAAQPSRPELAAYAVRTPEAAVNVCLLNKDAAQTFRVQLRPRRRFADASVLRLAGPSLAATAGVTLGGAAVDEYGAWRPARETHRLRDDGDLVIDVPAGSGVTVTLRA
jgi:hypothetical protein